MTSKTFPLGDLLTATTGSILVDRLSRVRELVDHVTGYRHHGHQVRAALPVVREHLMEQHPWLAEITVPRAVNSEATARGFLDATALVFGAEHEVEQMPFGAYVGRESKAEMEEMVGKDRVIPVVLPGHHGDPNV